MQVYLTITLNFKAGLSHFSEIFFRGTHQKPLLIHFYRGSAPILFFVHNYVYLSYIPLNSPSFITKRESDGKPICGS
jgi:hypothetical protein